MRLGGETVLLSGLGAGVFGVDADGIIGGVLGATCAGFVVAGTLGVCVDGADVIVGGCVVC